MSRFSKFKTLPTIVAATGLSSLLFLNGCGGGGSGGGGGGTPSGTPSPFDGTYAATAAPSTPVPSDGQAPTSSLVVARGKGTAQFTFFLQPSVVSQVQAAVNKGLTDAGYGGDIPNNIVPQSIAFSPTGQVDGSGKLILTQTLTARANVSLCGSAKVTLDPTFTTNGAAITGQGTYTIEFANDLTARIRGRDISITGTCNNLPLRSGTISFTK